MVASSKFVSAAILPASRRGGGTLVVLIIVTDLLPENTEMQQSGFYISFASIFWFLFETISFRLGIRVVIILPSSLLSKYLATSCRRVQGVLIIKLSGRHFALSG